MARLRSANWTVWVGMACILSFGAPRVTCSQNAATDPCNGANVAAYVSRVQSQCFLYGAAAPKLRSAASLNSPLHAGDEIECSLQGKLTITFCASGADVDIQHSDTQKYVVPNVPAKNGPETQGESRALRPVLQKPTRSDVQEVVAQGGKSGASVVPTCDAQIGTLVIDEPQEKWWKEYGLESPAAFITSLALQSKCFAVVESTPQSGVSGPGSLGSSPAHMRGAKGADYVLVPDRVKVNGFPDRALTKAEGATAGAAAGALIGGLLGKSGTLPLPGAALSGFAAVSPGHSRTRSADVVLKVTDGRTADELATMEGMARGGYSSSLEMLAKSAIGSRAEPGTSAGSSLAQLVDQAYVDAFIRLVKYVQARHASLLNFYCDGASGAVSEGAVAADRSTGARPKRFRADITSVRAAAGAMVIGVVSPPPGEATIIINDEVVAADAHPQRLDSHEYSGFMLYRVSGTSAELNLRMGENRLVARYGDRSLPAYAFSCRPLT